MLLHPMTCKIGELRSVGAAGTGVARNQGRMATSASFWHRFGRFCSFLWPFLTHFPALYTTPTCMDESYTRRVACPHAVPMPNRMLVGLLTDWHLTPLPVII